MQIAVDGPAGVGKSTVAHRLAQRLGALYVNTGAMYRALAWGLHHGLGLDQIHIRVDERDRVRVNGRDVTDALYTDEVDRWASEHATEKAVRAKLIEQQRAVARGRNVVMEGRDIGTVVLPEADLKLYLTASIRERARRRARQRGGDADEIAGAMRARDARDAEGFGRQTAPDAVVIDTEGLDIEDVVQRALECLKKREGASKL